MALYQHYYQHYSEKKTSKHDNYFFRFNCFHLLRTKKKSESHKKVFRNKYFFNVIMSPEHTKILEFKQLHKTIYYLYIS